MKKLLVILLLGVIAAACSKKEESETVLKVASEKGVCHLLENYPCYIVKYEGNDTWQRMGETIIDFDYEPGYEYELLVVKIEKKNPPLDWGGAYRLKRIVSKIQKDSENLPLPAVWELEEQGEQ